jgi:hypothetical protein
VAAGAFTPYSTAGDFFGSKPNWIPWELDIMRIQSYQAYEQMYWNAPDTFKVALRGSNDLPIYIPSARTIIDTTHRYTAPGLGVVTRDRDSGQPTTDSAAALMALTDFMRRERFKSKFNGFKRYGLIRGDSLWHITADETKPEGSRISITAIDPAMYFPIYDDEDVDKILGVHLVEYLDTADGPRIRRLTYRKVPRTDGTNTITVEDGLFEIDKWGGPDATAQTIIQQPTDLPPEITSIPVYHVKNFEEPGNPFGSSEIRGFERIMSAVNQTVSDESLALALAGIGVYATDSSQPIDPVTKKPVAWKLGPGRVVHYDGTKWDRVQGVSSVQPFGDHYDRLWTALKQASSTPDIAIGAVDVKIAQSGIALSLQLGPMLAKAGEKNDLIVDVHTQMFYDLTNMWMSAYEATSFNNVTVDCVTGDAVPVDRQARFAELNDMLDRGVIDTGYYREEAKKLGYVFPDDIGPKSQAEFQARNQDQFGARVTEELDSAES